MFLPLTFSGKDLLSLFKLVRPQIWQILWFAIGQLLAKSTYVFACTKGGFLKDPVG